MTTYFDERVGALANQSGPAVIGMLAWIDPSGQWWMAPLGSPAPDPDRAIPAAWVPIKRLQRGDMV